MTASTSQKLERGGGGEEKFPGVANNLNYAVRSAKDITLKKSLSLTENIVSETMRNITYNLKEANASSQEG